MSVIIYNGVQLSLTKINSLVQEPIYSEDGVDYLYTRFMLDVSAVVNLDVKPTMGNARVNLATTMQSYIQTLREQLNQPRATLQVYLGADAGQYPQASAGPLQALLFSPGPDAKAGPFPRGVLIRQVGGSKTLIINFSIETFVSELYCPDREKPRRVVSNRYEMSFSYDSEGMATRNIRGNLVVDGSQGIKADDFRHLCVPKMMTGWKRKRMDFVQTSDGLKLAYTIEDQEVYLAAPEGFTTIEGTYTENTTTAGGTIFADVEVRAKAPKNVTKSWLLTRALQVAHSRVEVHDTFQKGDDLLKGASVRENLFANEITVVLRVQKQGYGVGKRKNQMFDSQIGNFLFFIDKDGNYSTLEPDGESSYTPPYGTALVEAAYQAWALTPCVELEVDDFGRTKNSPVTSSVSTDTENPPTDPASEKIADVPDPPTATVSVAEPDEYEMSMNRIKWALEHRNNPYTDYDVKETIVTEPYILPAPVQKPPQRVEGGGPPTIPDPKPPDPAPARPWKRWKIFPIYPIPEPGEWIETPSTYWTPPDMIQLRPPKQERIIVWSAERANQWPVCPIAYERLQNGDVLLSKTIQFQSPTLGPDGETYVCNATGEYRYSCTYVTDETITPMWAGNMPWVADPDASDAETKVWGVHPRVFQPRIADEELADAFTDEELGIA